MYLFGLSSSEKSAEESRWEGGNGAHISTLLMLSCGARGRQEALFVGHDHLPITPQ